MALCRTELNESGRLNSLTTLHANYKYLYSRGCMLPYLIQQRIIKYGIAFEDKATTRIIRFLSWFAKMYFFCMSIYGHLLNSRDPSLANREDSRLWGFISGGIFFPLNRPRKPWRDLKALFAYLSWSCRKICWRLAKGEASARCTEIDRNSFLYLIYG